MKIIDKNYLKLYLRWCFEFTFELCGYFDNRPRINIGIIFFRLTLILPFTNKWSDECCPPTWGIAIHNRTFWLYYGGEGNGKGGTKWITYNFPLINSEWIRTSILLKDDSWEHETKGNRKDFWKDEWKEKQKCWVYNFTDKYDNSIIPTKIYVEEREWRPKWLTWTKLFSKTIRSIDIHFQEEVGKSKGSWKGGTLECGYNLLKNETPIECIKRMEKERNF